MIDWLLPNLDRMIYWLSPQFRQVSIIILSKWDVVASTLCSHPYMWWHVLGPFTLPLSPTCIVLYTSLRDYHLYEMLSHHGKIYLKTLPVILSWFLTLAKLLCILNYHFSDNNLLYGNCRNKALMSRMTRDIKLCLYNKPFTPNIGGN